MHAATWVLSSAPGLGAEGSRHCHLAEVLSVTCMLQLSTQSAPGGLLSGDCLSPRGQRDRSPQNTILHLQDKYAVRLLCICSTWEVNLGYGIKRRARMRRCCDGQPFLRPNWDQWSVQKQSWASLLYNTAAEVASSLTLYCSILAKSVTEVMGRLMLSKPGTHFIKISGITQVCSQFKRQGPF